MIVAFSESEDIINGPAKDTAPFMYPNDSSNDLSRTETGTIVQPSTEDNESNLDGAAFLLFLVPAMCVLLFIIAKLVGYVVGCFADNYSEDRDFAPAWWQFRLQRKAKARYKADVQNYVEQGNETFARMIHHVAYLDFSTALDKNTEIQKCLESFTDAKQIKAHISGLKKVNRTEALHYANAMSDFERVMTNHLDAINGTKTDEPEAPEKASPRKPVGWIIDKRRITSPLHEGFFGARRAQKDDAR